MVIDSLSNPTWSLVRTANYSTSGYPTKIPTITKPSGTGVITFSDPGNYCPLNLILLPFAAGSATNTFSLKILAWRPTLLGVGAPLWIPIVLGTWAVTVGTGTGVATADMDTTALFATTITMTGGPTFVTSGAAPICPDWFQVSPTGNDIGMISCRSFGFPLMEVIFTTGGSATSCNALYCKM